MSAKVMIGRSNSNLEPVGEMTIGDYLVKRLHHYGVEHVFGIPGDYVITFYEQMRQSGLIEPVNTVDEQGSGFAADSYARLKGLGAVCQTYGVGGLKALHTTAEAFTEKSPVVVISGAPGMKERSKGTLLHHLIDGYYSQLKMFEEVTVATTILEDTTTAFSEIDRVISAALREQRPVYIEIPRDMYTLNGDPDHVPSAYRRPGSNQAALQEALREATDLINRSEQPVIWAGVELQRFGMKGNLASLLESTNIPFATTILGKAVLSELHPQFLGVYQGVLSVPEVREYVESSDCLISLGVILTDVNLGLFTANIDPANHIFVSADSVSILGRSYEQVRFEDFIEGLAKAEIAAQAGSEMSRLVESPEKSADSIYLQSSTGEVISLGIGESIAGRNPGNPITIDDPAISRQHASFRREGNELWITDLKSSNGTFINDVMLPANVPQQLEREDEIGLGRRLTYTVLGPVAGPDDAATGVMEIEEEVFETVIGETPGDESPEPLRAGVQPKVLPTFMAVPGKKITSGRMFEAVNAFLDDTMVVTADNGETLIAGVDLLIRNDEGFFAPGYYTSVGFAVPIALGAQLANPERRPVVLAGDAAFQMTGVELSTFTRLDLNPIVIVMNNGGYGSERPIHDEAYVDVHKWDYARFTDVLNSGLGISVKTEDEFEEALQEAQAYSSGFVIIDVHLEKFDYSPSFERFLSFFAKGV